ncbi:MAG: peptidoglycan-binding protein, partial [Nocardioidaceae bacterium]|nr:peptidoglycan-binding protein [Nocardioidaceae bacterium]
MKRASRAKAAVAAVVVTATVVSGGAYAASQFAGSETVPAGGAGPRPTRTSQTPDVATPEPATATPSSTTESPESPGAPDGPTTESEPPSTPVETTRTAPPPPPPPLIAAQDSGTKVRELQGRLKQILWYYGDITGQYGEPTVEAVTGFQVKRGLPSTGEVDRRTWQRLLGMTRMPTYNEMHNILVPGPTIIGPEDDGKDVRDLQARLAQIAWFDERVTGYYGEVTTAAVTGFQTKRAIPTTGEVDQRTWDRLLEMTEQPGE